MREKDEWALSQREAGKTYAEISIAWCQRCGLEDYSATLSRHQHSDNGRRAMLEAKKNQESMRDDSPVF